MKNFNLLIVLSIFIPVYTLAEPVHVQHHTKHHHKAKVLHYELCEEDSHDMATGDDDACSYSDMQIN